METGFFTSLWAWVVIGGPVLLIAVLIWAKLNNRRSAEAKRRTEAATRELYKVQDRDDKQADGTA